MKRTIRQWAFTAFAVCGNAVVGVAGDSVKYQFDGWTVTVTPRRSMALSTVRGPIPTKRTVSSNLPDDTPSPGEPHVLIRPVSMRQEDPTPLSTAVTDNVEPQLKSTPEPTPTKVVSPVQVIQQQTTVVPGYEPDLPIIAPRPHVEPLKPQVFVPQTALYRDIYNSIPFNRAEYDAYPSYRHDATMELLFNQMRPTVIQRGSTYVNNLGVGGGGYGFPNGYPYTYPYTPYYPFSYGLRIHRSP